MLLQILCRNRLTFVIFLMFLQRIVAQDIKQYFSQCSTKSNKKIYDNCLKNALNEMRIFFHSGKMQIMKNFTKWNALKNVLIMRVIPQSLCLKYVLKKLCYVKIIITYLCRTNVILVMTQWNQCITFTFNIK